MSHGMPIVEGHHVTAVVRNQRRDRGHVIDQRSFPHGLPAPFSVAPFETPGGSRLGAVGALAGERAISDAVLKTISKPVLEIREHAGNFARRYDDAGASVRGNVCFYFGRSP